MGLDEKEARRRHSVDKPKHSTKHPYAAIEHRVIDSPAFAELTYSARAVLTLLTRQLTKDNNGHLQATFSYLRRFGIVSERTIARAIDVLISHGIIYRTRVGGYQQGASQYAVTWLPIKIKDGLFLDGFKLYAWRDWEPAEKKSPPAKKPDTHGKNGMWTTSAPAKNTADTPRKNADIELMPCRGAFSIPAGARYSGQVSERPWIQAELARLTEVSLGGCQCFQIPAKSPLMGRNH